MVFDYKVKHNGKYYEAGQEVPMEESPDFFEKNGVPFSDSEIDLETKPHVYTEEELAGMSVREIKRLAEDIGITMKKTAREDVVNEFLTKQWR